MLRVPVITHVNGGLHYNTNENPDAGLHISKMETLDQEIKDEGFKDVRAPLCVISQDETLYCLISVGIYRDLAIGSLRRSPHVPSRRGRLVCNGKSLLVLCRQTHHAEQQTNPGDRCGLGRCPESLILLSSISLCCREVIVFTILGQK